jgi:hypothetical protein
MAGIAKKGATSIVRVDEFSTQNKYTTYIYGEPI